jgi:hypothetical protein
VLQFHFDFFFLFVKTLDVVVLVAAHDFEVREASDAIEFYQEIAFRYELIPYCLLLPQTGHL